MLCTETKGYHWPEIELLPFLANFRADRAAPHCPEELYNQRLIGSALAFSPHSATLLPYSEPVAVQKGTLNDFKKPHMVEFLLVEVWTLAQLKHTRTRWTFSIGRVVVTVSLLSLIIFEILPNIIGI